MTFAEKFLTLRKSENMSQEEIAEKLNVSRQAISRWEMGTAMPDAQNLLQISRLFKVSIDYLLNDEVAERINTVVNVEASTNKKRKLKPLYFIAVYIVGLLLFPTVFTSVTAGKFVFVNIIKDLSDPGMIGLQAIGIIFLYSRIYVWAVILWALICFICRKSKK